MVAAKIKRLSIAFGVDGGCSIQGHAADGVLGHGVRLFHGHFPFSVVIAPAGQRYGHSPWRTTCLSPFSNWVALWDLATIAINALGVPTSSYQGAMFPTSSNATAWVVGDTARQNLRFP
jgi:hypothetical protein